MPASSSGSLYSIVIVVAVLAFVIVRRMRPQVVRPRALIVRAVIIVVVLGLTLLGTATRLLSDVAALLLAPLALVIGAMIGWLLVRTMTFWTEPSTGQLWMKGGALFAIVLVGTMGLRIGFRALTGGATAGYASFGSASPGSHGFVSDLSTDLVFLAMGMWLMRSLLIYLRWREHESVT
jgi:hypothetical protein